MKVGEFIKNFDLIKDETEVILNVSIEDPELTYIVKGEWYSDHILKHYNEVIESITIYLDDINHAKQRVVIFIIK